MKCSNAQKGSLPCLSNVQGAKILPSFFRAHTLSTGTAAGLLMLALTSEDVLKPEVRGSEVDSFEALQRQR